MVKIVAVFSSPTVAKRIFEKVSTLERRHAKLSGKSITLTRKHFPAGALHSFRTYYREGVRRFEIKK